MAKAYGFGSLIVKESSHGGCILHLFNVVSQQIGHKCWNFRFWYRKIRGLYFSGLFLPPSGCCIYAILWILQGFSLWEKIDQEESMETSSIVAIICGLIAGVIVGMALKDSQENVITRDIKNKTDVMGKSINEIYELRDSIIKLMENR